jgi:hypothetical protein
LYNNSFTRKNNIEVEGCMRAPYIKIFYSEADHCQFWYKNILLYSFMASVTNYLMIAQLSLIQEAASYIHSLGHDMTIHEELHHY